MLRGSKAASRGAVALNEGEFPLPMHFFLGFSEHGLNNMCGNAYHGATIVSGLPFGTLSAVRALLGAEFATF
eukprot:605349-Pelagomonas_calceolata.AAC.3